RALTRQLVTAADPFASLFVQRCQSLLATQCRIDPGGERLAESLLSSAQRANSNRPHTQSERKGGAPPSSSRRPKGRPPLQAFAAPGRATAETAPPPPPRRLPTAERPQSPG